MGNIFARRPLALSNPELIEHLKSKKITDINDVIETLDCYYQLQQSLNLQEFTDAFQVFLEGYTQQFFI
jgi:hypothetical protein